ncbi:hypothetical protein SK128_007146 [Halocaridina rubra]|uniref:Uncharacterized protein n=1 Tax=Halocaridina rubra TaxID=373956 RepID=A0AAN8WN25_HALRR
MREKEPNLNNTSEKIDRNTPQSQFEALSRNGKIPVAHATFSQFLSTNAYRFFFHFPAPLTYQTSTNYHNNLGPTP